MPRNRIEITATIKDELNDGMNRTGLGGRALMRGRRGEYPEGLTGAMIDKWRAGTIKSAKPAQLEWVLQAYRDWSPPLSAPLKPEKITLTPEHRAFLQSEVERTGLGAVAILRHAPKPLPEGLNHQKVQRWVSGDTKRVAKANWEFVLRLYWSIAPRRWNG